MRLTENDIHYLNSIKGHLRELYELASEGPSLAGEVAADNMDWLDCFIDRARRDAKPEAEG